MQNPPAVKTNNKPIKPINDDPTIESSGHFMAYFVVLMIMVVIAYIVYHKRQKVCMSCLSANTLIVLKQDQNLGATNMQTSVNDIKWTETNA